MEPRPGTVLRNCSTEAAAVPGRVGAGGPACEDTAAVSVLCGSGAGRPWLTADVSHCLRSIVTHGCLYSLGSRWLTPSLKHQGPAAFLEVSIGYSARGTLGSGTGHSQRPISSDVPVLSSKWVRGAVGVGGCFASHTRDCWASLACESTCLHTDAMLSDF